MKTPKYGLTRSERVRGRKLIDRLFSEGNSGFVFPLRYCYLVEKADTTDSGRVSIMVSVPKRHFKRAVKRNLLKRRIREAFRLNKNILSDSIPDGLKIHIAFIYGCGEVAEFRKIKSTMKRILNDIDKKSNISVRCANPANPANPAVSTAASTSCSTAANDSGNSTGTHADNPAGVTTANDSSET